MRSYWMRILLGALAIFAIGMIGVTLGRRGRDKVTEVVTGSGPLNFPLPFVPFQVDGNKLGTVEHLTINREAPKKLSSVHLEVKLEDSLIARGWPAAGWPPTSRATRPSRTVTSTSTSVPWGTTRSSSAPGTTPAWSRSGRSP